MLVHFTFFKINFYSLFYYWIVRYLVYFESVNLRYLNSQAPVPVVYPAVSQCSSSQISAVYCPLLTTLPQHCPTHLPPLWIVEPLWLHCLDPSPHFSLGLFALSVIHLRFMWSLNTLSFILSVRSLQFNTHNAHWSLHISLIPFKPSCT